MIAAMDTAGVGAAIIVSTFNLYRYDSGHAPEVHAKWPYQTPGFASTGQARNRRGGTLAELRNSVQFSANFVQLRVR